METSTLLTIGYGKMGSEIVERAIGIGFKPHLVLKDKSCIKDLPRIQDITYTIKSIPKKKFDFVLLSVKPQNLSDMEDYAAELLQHKDNEKAIIFSIMAGISVNALRKSFPKNPIVRTMPTLALKFGKSFTLSYQDGLKKHDLEQVSSLLEALGTYEFTENENFLNSIIPISGSGLAYVMYFALRMIEAGIEIGLPKELTKNAIFETISSAVTMCESKSFEEIERTIKNICSKGGTTEAGIKSLEENSFGDIISRCIKTTNEKAEEISKSTNTIG